ncbi:acireductone synthase [Swingsia samuiensis]|uniref:Enolase-phosphatase E1 n=1 Tax=Swingsia samuiensis TaxID=1293412 RepID=A0A4Y6UJV4_9PROT|nr:acireductone synthase [Swingsia samuiensis]QDH16756.1 acireductone synthase [Swingsia samuiensis]
MIRLVLLDIEGTTLPISFVRDVMFPYAAKALPAVIEDHANPQVVGARADIVVAYPDKDPLTVCQEWMEKDEKAAPLKTLQGIAWKKGFEDGALRASLYPDVVPVLKKWSEAGLRLSIYSSGSIASQKLLYSHTEQGDITSLFDDFFDLSTGSKKEQESYTKIAQASQLKPAEILFLSDIGAELEAAQKAGFQVCQLVRPQDGTVPLGGVKQALDLYDVAQEFDLDA